MTMWAQESAYFQSLTRDDKNQYRSKLTLTDGKTLPDPNNLKDWKDDVSLLPDIGMADVYMYLIHTPSQFTHDSLKCYKSLDAYNSFLNGHVQDVYYHEIERNSDYAFIKSEVLPSQRQGKKTSLYSVWIAINKEKGYIHTANCTCPAGLRSACSHVAALMFKLDACTKLGLNKIACTSTLCKWKQSRKKCTPAPLKSMSFSRPKKHQTVPTFISDDTENQTYTSYCQKDPTANSSFWKTKLQELDRISNLSSIQPAVLRCVDLDVSNEEAFESNSSTDTAEEDESNSLPEPLTSIYLPDAINYNEKELEEKCLELYNNYKQSHHVNQFINLEKVTKKQSDSKVWKLHRAGRITASLSKTAFSLKLKQKYPKSFVESIMQYRAEVNVAATNYGKRMENIAKCSYIEAFAGTHDEMKVLDSGLNILHTDPYLGASPDGIVTCKCHGTGVLEIKCPYKYKNGLTGALDDSNFPIDKDGMIKQNHLYYFQVQHQMLVTGFKYGHFYIWTQGASVNDKIMLLINRNDSFIDNLKEKLSEIFFKVILPEVVSRSKDTTNNMSAKLYCKCNRPSFPPMVACDGENCKIEWFHYSCVQIARAPKGKWFCAECKTKLT